MSHPIYLRLGEGASADLHLYWILKELGWLSWAEQLIFKLLGEINVSLVLPICREYSACKAVSPNNFTFCSGFRGGLGREAAMDSAHMSSDWWGRGKKYLSLISLDDVYSGKEVLGKGTEALNKSNQIMSNRTISADEGHFELANPFAWQIITFIFSCKLYSLSFLTKLGYFCNLFQSLQQQSAAFLPLDPQHPSDIHYWLIPRGLPAVSCRWLMLPSSAPGIDSMKYIHGVLRLGGNKKGWGKRERGLQLLSHGSQMRQDACLCCVLV